MKRMFSLAVRSGRLSQDPFIPMLQEDNARQGFLDHGGFLALRDALPYYLKDSISFLSYSGWRLGEMRSHEWRDADLEGHVIRLRPENSKNKESRTLSLSGELGEIIGRAEDSRRLECPFVFHRDGKAIGDLRKHRDKACDGAGLKGLLVHDLRRTAAGNMIRAGIPERIAMKIIAHTMKIIAHTTRSTFDPYNIVTEQDLQDAAKQLEAQLARQPQSSKVVPIAR
jgi:integrase